MRPKSFKARLQQAVVDYLVKVHGDRVAPPVKEGRNIYVPFVRPRGRRPARFRVSRGTVVMETLCRGQWRPEPATRMRLADYARKRGVVIKEVR